MVAHPASISQLTQLGPAVPDLHDEQARKPVDIAFAAVVEDGDALTAGDDGRGDIGPMTGEMTPQMPFGLGCQVG